MTDLTTIRRLPKDGFLRLRQIIGDSACDRKEQVRRNEDPEPPLIPVSKTTWYKWIKAKRAPEPIKLGPFTSAWRVKDILALISSLDVDPLCQRLTTARRIHEARGKNENVN